MNDPHTLWKLLRPPSYQYASSSEYFFPQALLPQIMKKVDEVRRDAGWNEKNQADEDQWNLLVVC